MSVKVRGSKLRKGSSMTVSSSDIYPRLQKLINKGYLTLEKGSSSLKVHENFEPDENLPDTDPAPEVPAPTEEIVVVPSIVEDTKEKEIVEETKVVKSANKPKITRRRKKKASAKSEE